MSSQTMNLDEKQQWEKYIKDTGNDSEYFQSIFLNFIRKYPLLERGD